MKLIRILSVSILFTLFSACDDGDLTIETINFTGTNATSCTNDVRATFLYKLQGNQALILDFGGEILTNSETIQEKELPTQAKLIYRTFSQAPSGAYFCTTPPMSTPRVTSEIEARGGKVRIETIAVTDPVLHTTKYNHKITISDLIIQNDKGEQLIDRNFIFGTYQTQP